MSPNHEARIMVGRSVAVLAAMSGLALGALDSPASAEDPRPKTYEAHSADYKHAVDISTRCRDESMYNVGATALGDMDAATVYVSVQKANGEMETLPPQTTKNSRGVLFQFFKGNKDYEGATFTLTTPDIDPPTDPTPYSDIQPFSWTYECTDYRAYDPSERTSAPTTTTTTPKPATTTSTTVQHTSTTKAAPAKIIVSTPPSTTRHPSAGATKVTPPPTTPPSLPPTTANTLPPPTTTPETVTVPTTQPAHEVAAAPITPERKPAKSNLLRNALGAVGLAAAVTGSGFLVAFGLRRRDKGGPTTLRPAGGLPTILP